MCAHDRLRAMIRTSSLLLTTLAFTGLSIAAHAQLSAYGTVTVDRLTGISSSPLRSPGVVYNDSVSPIGFTGGARYDFKTVGPVRLGADVRGVVMSSNRGAEQASAGAGTKIYSGLGGLRATFVTPIFHIKPYVQASAGIGRSNYGILLTSSNSLKNNFEYHAFAGVEIPILPLLDLRVVELGYGAMNSLGTGSHTYPMQSVSTGIVLHFPLIP